MSAYDPQWAIDRPRIFKHVRIGRTSACGFLLPSFAALTYWWLKPMAGSSAQGQQVNRDITVSHHRNYRAYRRLTRSPDRLWNLDPRTWWPRAAPGIRGQVLF